jgi:hypothetical protein
MPVRSPKSDVGAAAFHSQSSENDLVQKAGEQRLAKGHALRCGVEDGEAEAGAERLPRTTRRIRGAGKDWDGSAEFGSNLSRRLQSDGAPLLGPEHR